MDISYHKRNVELSSDVRDLVEEKLRRATRQLDGMERAEIHLFEERNPRVSDKEVCEITLHGHGHVVRARAAGPEVLSAVDRVIDKLEHRMEKLKGKLLGRSHPRRSAALDSVTGRSSANEPPDDADQDQSRIVKTKQFAIKPMTPEEASLQMELLGHDFFFFSNADTGRAAVVYQRRDGFIGLIDAT